MKFHLNTGFPKSDCKYLTTTWFLNKLSVKKTAKYLTKACTYIILLKNKRFHADSVSFILELV